MQPVPFSSRADQRPEQLYGKSEKRRLENEKLNKLIHDYKQENERCSYKIQELKSKLQNTKMALGDHQKPSTRH